ncbi:MAG: hypothetical protein A2W61_07170 [Deltaproteobacteria bacterium RIFCSPLOWO2_01_44_7]|nr:MAG: hypothetical protein A2712_07400 [Deltaproteobacteria bacterium RIFCSPHIGHO2_01_FULL_43_49]OGQ15768.1 MAG: hypothetical protein A3D22_06190 [Deltaproteobacteria bacterium RIFCSPHIGHO2_02_FULL_44_53]OGQ29427.1 MAG: hypothetical protein A3D98_11065 [Deltaproteobacteria bacterium RIFCSPHIGHO2_12_FULL_44_21]OGQ32061.1 MAG: hypothetical protein A2979_03135 [Deltaproteobacteria bacterium RIFCSPLOWO2_01_FULL_45_74]OGQ40642.1 MAG: hypothetical protein A2W61_07170 [Deltaproteobacteria bacterium 
MSYETELTKKEKKLQSEKEAFEATIATAQKELDKILAQLELIEDVRKKVPQSNKPNQERPLREGSELAHARDIIKSSGKPMHADEILKALGKELTRANKASIVGSLNRYSEEGRTFYKDAPNTFGLLTMKKEEGNVKQMFK